MTTYERINSLRKNRGVTWTYLEEKISGYRGKFTGLKQGKTTLTSYEIFQIAVALNTSTDYLLGNTDDPSPAGQKEKPTPAPESGLTDPLDIQLAKELPGLTPDQKELLLAQIRVLKGKT